MRDLRGCHERLLVVLIVVFLFQWFEGKPACCKLRGMRLALLVLQRLLGCGDPSEGGSMNGSASGSSLCCSVSPPEKEVALRPVSVSCGCLSVVQKED